MDYESQILQEYFLEAREILSESELLFLQLESHPNDQTLIDTIFRLIHTLKGSAFSVGLEDFGRFAHRLESMLDLIRNHKIPIQADIISLALQVNDAQKDWLNELQRDPSYVADVESLVQRIAAIVTPFESDAHQATLPAFGLFADETPREDKPRLRLLLVDDLAEQMDIYKDMLSSLNLEIHCAGNGLEALALLRQHKMDVILTDLDMPEMGGLEMIHRIRSAEITTPIIFISGFGARQDIIDLMNSGANGFLEKPVRQEALLAQLRSALKEKYLQDTVSNLTQLNFKAFLASSQLSRLSIGDSRRLKLEQRLISILDEIINLQNAVLQPKMVLHVL